jgi:hypothetical protein
MWRNVLAGICGAVVAFITIGLLEAVGTTIFPPPPGMDFNDRESVRAAMANMPFGALVWVLVSQLVGTFVGAWLAARIARAAKTALAVTVGVIAMLASIGNMLMIPHPIWFWVASLLFSLPLAYLGGLLACRASALEKPAVV